MAVVPSQIQVRRDKQLREQLVADRGVKAALAQIDVRSSGWGFGGRRRLLTGALRLTRNMSPEVADALAACREMIGFKEPIEMYIKPEPVMNAFCMRNPSGPLIVCISSRLLETFSPAELKFVIGHEMGHAAFDHHGIPMPVTAMIEDMGGAIVSRPISLQLYLWCRAAELSADRVGMICAQDPEAAASGFFKLASGLSSPRVKADLEAYARQVESLASVPDARKEVRDDDDTLDCFSTHPYSPLRVRAVVAFGKSKPYLDAIGKANTGIALEDVEAIVERDLEMMEPSYLEEKTVKSELMRKVLFNAGMMVAAANGVIDKSELKALSALLGADYTTTLPDIERVKKEVEPLLDQAVKDVSLAGRAQLIQHLTIIAAADGTVDAFEIAEMHRLASRLGVDVSVIEQTLAGAAAPMD
jgi:tellurite resistance protein